MDGEAAGGRGPRCSRRALLGAAGGLTVGLAGCIVHGTDSGLEGEIVVDGSDTLYPNTALVAELFLWENNQVEIPVRGGGTGAGFQQFARGETDLQNASRPITEDERDLCADNGVEFFRLDVVRDGIAIMKHRDNDWCRALTTEQLGRIWERDTEIQSWRDLAESTADDEWSDDQTVTDPEEWPDERISLYGRDTASGTFDYFTENVTGTVGNIRSDYSGTPDSNAIVRGVRDSRYAMGFAGAGFYYENEDDLDLIEVDDGDGGVAPEPETIQEGIYSPLSRSMYLYVNEGTLEREAVRAFLRHYLDVTQETALDVGFYAVSDETIADQHAKLDETFAPYEDQPDAGGNAPETDTGGDA